MNKPIALAVLVLFVMLSACISPPPPSTEDDVIEFTNNTVEGQVANHLKDALLKTEDCTLGEYRGIVSTLSFFLPEDLLEKLEGDDETVDEAIEKAIECESRVIRNVEAFDGSGYLVSYNLESSSDCRIDEFNTASEYTLEIEVNPADGTAEVITGGVDDETREQLRTLIPAFLVVGNCIAPIAVMAIPETPASSDGDVDTNTGVDGGTGVGVDVNAGTGVDVDVNAGTGVDVDVNAGTGVDVDVNAGVDVDTNTGIEIDPPRDPEVEPAGRAVLSGEISFWASGEKLATFPESDNPNALLALKSGAKTIILTQGTVLDAVFHRLFGSGKEASQDGHIIISEEDGTVKGKWLFSGATVDSVLSGYYYIQEARIDFWFTEKTG